MVLCILALWQVPAKIRPLIETVPVKGHLLSMYVPVPSEKQIHTLKNLNFNDLIIKKIISKKKKLERSLITDQK